MKLYFMPIDPRRLVVLRAVDRYGGVVGAAAALRISPSAVSQQLVMLERETGFVVVDRSRRGGQRPIEFTTAGRRLIAHADKLAQVLEDAEAELGGLADSVDGSIVLGAFVTVLRGFAGEALVALSRSNPRLRPSVRQIDDRPAAEDLLAGRIDLALVEDDTERRAALPRGLYYEALADDPFRVAVPVGWPEFDRLEAVADRPWVDGPADSAVGQAMKRVRRTSRLRLPPAHLCHDFAAGLSLVSAGLAGAFVPDLAFSAAAPVDVRLVTLPALGARRIGVLYRRSRNEPTPAVRTVLEALRTAATATEG